MFEFENVNFNMYIHIINFDTKNILLRNEKNQSIKISMSFRLDRVIELNYFHAYQVFIDVINLIIKHFKKNHQKIYHQLMFRTIFFEFKSKVEQKLIVKTKEKIIIHNLDSDFTKNLINFIKEYFAV